MNGGQERTRGSWDHNPELLQSTDVLRCDVLPERRRGLRRVPGYRVTPESGRIDPDDCGREMSLARKWNLLSHDEREKVRWFVYFDVMDPKAAIDLIFYLSKKRRGK